jgi:hypothetical protein
MATLAEIRARLAKDEEKTTFKTTSGASFPFWDAATGTTTTIRFLPDANPNNQYFWQEKKSVRLPFTGIKGRDSKPLFVTVPSLEMWEDLKSMDAIGNEVRKLYSVANGNKESDEYKLASKYYRKVTYLFQGFVRDSSVKEDSAPENPIRIFNINKQLYNIVKSGIMDPDMDNLPTDYEHGLDFRILKTAKGEYADYGTSAFGRRENALTATEQAAIEAYGLSNLSELIGKKPTADDIRVIEEMFEASANGEEYDLARWGNTYRPYGLDSATTPANDSATSTPSAAKEESKETVVEGSAQEPVKAKTSAADILAAIKARNAK